LINCEQCHEKIGVADQSAHLLFMPQIYMTR